MRVTFWGTRGSIATPGAGTMVYGGNTSCVEVRCGADIFIFDAGTGIRPLGLSLMREFAGRPLTLHLFISHTHWDHIQGFPFFTPAYQPETTIHVYGSPGQGRSLEKVLRGQMDADYFPVALGDMRSELHVHEFKGKPFDIGDAAVEAQYLNHPGMTLGYRLNHAGKALVYATDNEPYQHTLSHLGQHAQAGREFGRELDAEFVRFITGAKLYIGEAQYTDEEYPSRIGWGHSAISATVEVALAAQVRSLAFFHHDPLHDDPMVAAMAETARRLIEARGATLECFAAREGQVLELTTHATGDRISIPTIWVAVVLSLLLHAAALFGWLPKLQMRPSEGDKPGKPTNSLTARLAPRPPQPPPQPPAAAPAPRPVPPVQAQPAPAPRAARAAPQPQPAPAPRVLAQERPSSSVVAPPPPKEAPRAPPGEDLASYVETRRRARLSSIAPLPSQASPPSPAAPPVESEQERHNRAVAANLGLNQTPSFGQERNRGGGIFQIQRMGYDDAEFFFFGWNKDIRRNTQQMIEVRRGNNPNMEIAVVRRMIAIIREHVDGDFQFESQRLRKEVTLSARLRDTAGLEEFLMREFFWEARK